MELFDTEEAAKYLGITKARFQHFRSIGYNFMQSDHRKKARIAYTKEQLDIIKPKIEQMSHENKFSANWFSRFSSRMVERRKATSSAPIRDKCNIDRKEE